ncbi:PEP-CTERM sorting domain-containing protein [Fervidibacter sp.]
MKAMSKLLVTMLLSGLVCLWSNSARSAPVTGIDWSTFTGLANLSSPVVDPLFDVYRFGSAWVAGAFHGTIYSQVFPGQGAAAGLYVYVYQIAHVPSPTPPPPAQQYPFGAVSFPTFTNIPPSTVGSIQFFAITSGAPTIGFSTLGVLGPADGTFTPLGDMGQISFTFLPKLDFNTTSYIFGFFHPLPPTTVIANLVDSVPEQLNPLVYTPSPEPSSIALLGLGLLGVFLPRRFKKKSL